VANATEPFICGGNAAFLSNYFDHLLLLLLTIGISLNNTEEEEEVYCHFYSQRLDLYNMGQKLNM